MRLLVDMNLTPRWVHYLLDAGYECIHWSEIGPINAEDSTICAYARQHGFVIITNDLDFPQILAHTTDPSSSVILLRGEPLTPEFRGALC
jgi:predicted nuclease of predicted toxin-antitoxin system